MIISGDFIALSKGTDFVSTFDKDGDGPDLPEVIWFNIRNIVALSCYKDYYRLIIDDEHMVELKQPAANQLIALMRKKRDDEIRDHMGNLTDEEKKTLIAYFEKVKKAQNEMKENKEDK